MMVTDASQDRCKSTDLKRRMHRNGDVMLAILLGRRPNMASGLMRHDIAHPTERRNQIAARDVSRQLHAAMTSSLTKCSRIILGRAATSG